jgi:pyruvate/2-oxoglutarate dehydrogenase complex dihydrolipoamide acyltransferase (E2) component
MFERRRFSNHRRIVDDLLIRTREDHAPVAAALLWDVTDTLATIEALRSQGRAVGFTAFLVRATAMMLEKHRALNSRVFRRWYGPEEVRWDEVSCNLVVAREAKSGEEILFPLVIRNANTLSVEAIHKLIREAKQRPLDEMKELSERAKIQRLPRIALKAFSHLVRTRPDFYIRRFGTYGLSSLEHEGSGAVALVAPSPSTSFYPSSIEDRPVVRDGQIVIRKMLTFSMVLDHTLVDGLVGLRASLELKRLVEQPQWVLGDLLPAAVAAAS